MERRDFLKFAAALPFVPKILSSTPKEELIAPKYKTGIDLAVPGSDFTSIIIVCRNNGEYLNVTLQTLAINTLTHDYELIIVDNASDDQETIKFLKAIEEDARIKVIRNRENLYWAPAINIGVAQANPAAKYFVFMHSDIAFLNPRWLDMFINVLESSKSGSRVGLLGLEQKCWMINDQRVNWLDEQLLVTSREAWKQIGPFPDEFPQVGPGFVTCMKAQRLKWAPSKMILPNNYPIVHHYRMQSLDINTYSDMCGNTIKRLPGFLKKWTDGNS